MSIFDKLRLFLAGGPPPDVTPPPGDTEFLILGELTGDGDITLVSDPPGSFEAAGVLSGNGVIVLDGVISGGGGGGSVNSVTALPDGGVFVDNTDATNPVVSLAAVTGPSLYGQPIAGTQSPVPLTATEAKDLLDIAYTDVSGLATIAHTGSASDLGAGTVPAARMPALTGDVTSSAGSVATTIADGAVTNAKQADMPDATIKGNNAGSPHAPMNLTAAEAKAVLAIAYSDVSGLATVAHTGAYSDLTGAPSADLTRVNDTNVTITLGGTPVGSLLNGVSLTMGWNGLLPVARGGSGVGTLTGYVIGNGTAAMTASATIPYSDLTGTPAGAALTKVNDTNVTLTLGGSPSTALWNAASLTLGWTGQLAVSRGGTGAATLTGYVKGNGTSAMTAVSAVPASDVSGLATVATTGAYSDLTGQPTIPSVTPSALTKADDTNVTITLGGSPTVSLLAATSISLGWTGLLSVARGGSGVGTLTGYLKGNGTSAFSAVSSIPASDVTGLATVATTGVYSDLTGKPTLLSSPLTTKGDLWGFSTVNARLPVGTDTFVLTADSTQTLGVKWAAAGGSVTPAAMTKTDDTNVTLTLGGTPATSLLQATSLTLGWTGTLSVARGGSGAGTLTGYLKGTGTTAFTASATIPYSDLSGTPTIPTAANPTGTVGLATVNGVATTYMRSDGAPPLSQAITPTWTNPHTFSAQLNANGGVVLGAGSASLAPMKFTAGAALTTAVAGVQEYDGLNLFFSPVASSRAVNVYEFFQCLNATYTLTNTSAAQKLLNATTNGAITLPAGTYEFECLFSLTGMSSSSGSFGFALAGSATFTQSWLAQADKINGIASASNTPTTSFNTSSNASIAPTNAFTTGWALITGILRVTVGGTIIPQVSLGVGIAAVVGNKSFFRCRAIGGNAVTNVGNWS